MADSSKLVPFILSWETDKYTNNKKDRGGATKYGITLATWRRVGYDKNGDGVLNEEDVKLLTKDDFHRVFKQNYWNACKADKIQDQSVANMLVDFAYNSGVSRAVTYLQITLGITADGIIGNKTLFAINKSNGKRLFERFKNARENYLKSIARGTQKNHLNGWLRRVSYITYGHLKLNE
nr:MAG TPA: Lysozyme [Bacteriophage sp.]